MSSAEVSDDCDQQRRLRSQRSIGDNNGGGKRLKITKDMLRDPKLFANQSVDLHRLSPKVIKQYDRHSYRKYYKYFIKQKTFTKYQKMLNKFIKNSQQFGQPLTRLSIANNREVDNSVTAAAATNNAVNSSPKRMRLWVNNTASSSNPDQHLRQQSSNYRTLRSHSNDLKHWTKCEERENSLMSSSEYNRYLNLISVKHVNRLDDKQVMNSFALRDIAKCDHYFADNCDQILVNSLSQQLKPKLIDADNNTNANVILNNIKRRKRIVNKIKEKYRIIERQKQLIVNQWRSQYLRCLSIFPLSSPMGSRVCLAFKCQTPGKTKLEAYVKKYEASCTTRYRHRIGLIDNKYNRWKSDDLEKRCTIMELTHKNQVIGSHQYSFTKRQRLDRLRRFDTGIDWKSRLLNLHCNPFVRLSITRCYLCPLCRQPIGDDHSCDNQSDCDLNVNQSNVGINPTIRLAKQISSKMSLKRKNFSDTKIFAEENRPKIKPTKRLRICRLDLNLLDTNEK
ncbi:uncharacterized protein LOC128963940 [Oppia nitens]|uniref:uncharacterized protein LOC128963940 n=1 Tax=Oppia nitens TaxID=1686743 RepID=UPI0023DABA96|nr:uncharacterized protein LOC128963940 [Oppia nitens]